MRIILCSVDIFEIDGNNNWFRFFFLLEYTRIIFVIWSIVKWECVNEEKKISTKTLILCAAKNSFHNPLIKHILAAAYIQVFYCCRNIITLVCEYECVSFHAYGIRTYLLQPKNQLKAICNVLNACWGVDTFLYYMLLLSIFSYISRFSSTLYSPVCSCSMSDLWSLME